MNAEELIEAARKTADFQNATVAILEKGLNATWKNTLDLENLDQCMLNAVVKALREMILNHGDSVRLAVTIVAFEVQIENAKGRQAERNN